jgi:Flp pilus assembly protein TadB
MLLLIFVLAFFSIAYFAHEGIPLIMAKYSSMQQKRMEESSKSLNRFIVMKEGKKMLLVYSLAPLIAGGVLYVLTKNIFVGLAGLTVGFIIPKMIVKQMAAMRLDKCQDQLVDGLMVLSSALKSGHEP